MGDAFDHGLPGPLTDPRVLVVYNHFRQPGGDAMVVADQVRAMVREGWWVTTLEVTTPGHLTTWEQAAVGAGSIWSRTWRREVARRVERDRVDIVHIHNAFPLLSPSIVWGARDAGARVIMSLHDYRLVCPSGLCFREGSPCFDCLDRPLAWPGVVHGCYRGRHSTVAPAVMIAVHRMAHTWSEKVDRYVAPSLVQRDVLIAGGLPAERIDVIPNLVDPDPGQGPLDGGYCLFVGRLEPHKGWQEMVSAWRELDDIPLKIAAPYPTGSHSGELLDQRAGIEFLGRLPRSEVFELMKRSRLLVFPSKWFEVTPLTIIEAMACGLPVVASRLGSIVELVGEGQTGTLFDPWDASDLQAKVRNLWQNESLSREMGERARDHFIRDHTADVHLERLRTTYALTQ